MNVGPEEVEESQPPCVYMDMTEAQLDRIWGMLPIPEKALAILTALQADRSEAA